MYGILQKSLLGKLASGSKGTVTLEGELLGEKIKHILEFEVPGQGAGAGAVPTIHHLAGKALIRGLQNMESSGAKKDEIVKLSCECSVISKHTAFIAIDEEQKEPVKGSLQTWDVVARPPPMMGASLSVGVPMLCSMAGRSAAPLRMRQAVVLDEDSMEDSDSEDEEDVEMGFEENMPKGALLDKEIECAPLQLNSRALPQAPLAGLSDPSSGPPPSSAKSGQVAKPKSSSFQPSQPALPRIISLQLASGAWKLSAELAGLLGHSMEELKVACPAACEGELELVWATVLVLAYLEKKLLELKDEWELIAMKAKNWLKKQHVPEGHSTESFLEKAKTVV